MHQKRTAIITDANMHVGPDLARELASNHNLVLGEPAVGLVEEVTGLGADASGLDGVADLSDPESIKKLVEHVLAKYGRLDALVFEPVESLQVKYQRHLLKTFVNFQHKTSSRFYLPCRHSYHRCSIMVAGRL
jgi:short-subunit dehydrogenase